MFGPKELTDDIYHPLVYTIGLSKDVYNIDSVQKTVKYIKTMEDLKEYYAKKYHGSQMRQSGEPYYSHPIEVAYLLAEYTAEYDTKYFRTDLLVTAILHDTIEDTELTFEMIKITFGEIIACQVVDLTRIRKNKHKISSAEIANSLWLQKKYDILLIKLFDRLHNLQTIDAKSPEKIKKIVNETFNSFIIFSVK